MARKKYKKEEREKERQRKEYRERERGRIAFSILKSFQAFEYTLRLLQRSFVEKKREKEKFVMVKN